MSLKMQFRYQYRYFLQFLHGIAWPSWMENTITKMGVTTLVAVLIVGYVFQTNAIATRGYVVHNLEQRVAELQNDTEKIETQIAGYQSMTSIQKRLAKNAYITAHANTFMKVLNDTAVAQK